MRTFPPAGAATLLVLLALSLLPLGPRPAGAQPVPPSEQCSQPALGQPSACVVPEDGGTATTVADRDPADAAPGPALWVGAAFGISGLVGIALAGVGVRDLEPKDK